MGDRYNQIQVSHRLAEESRRNIANGDRLPLACTAEGDVLNRGVFDFGGRPEAANE